MSAVAEVMRQPGLRALQVGWACFFLVDGLSMIGLSVWAHARGGAAAVGLLALARLLPGAVALPFGAWAADRYPRHRVIAVVFLAMTITQGSIAAALAADLPTLAVGALVAVGSVAATPYRAAHLALVPVVARSSSELVAMNVTAGLLEGAATFAGPAAAAVILVVAEPWLVVAVAATIAAAALLATAGLRIHTDPTRSNARSADRPWAAAIGGVEELRRNGDVAVIVMCFVAQLLVRGLLVVLLVSVSFDLLRLDRSGVGWLSAAMGVGGIIGGVLSAGMTARRRLATPFAVALTLWGLPIALMGVGKTLLVVVALATIGIGNALLDVSGFTLIQRLGADRTLGRVFGVLFTAGIAVGGIGAAAAPALESALGLRWMLAAVGAVLPVLALVLLPRFKSIDRRAEPPPELLSLFASVPMLRPLPPTSLEKLATNCIQRTVTSGSTIVAEGDHGDHWFVIRAGSVVVRRHGIDVGELHAGDHFGEIALLHDVARTATVVAVTDVELAMLDTTQFLDALSSNEAAFGVAWSGAATIVESHAAGS